MQEPRWRSEPFSWDAAERIAAALDLPLVLGVVLARRGLTTPEAARAFLEPDGIVPSPFTLFGVREATTRIAKAISERRRIVIYGDYDADGITATALMVLGLRELGAHTGWFLPDRFEYGFGLSPRALRSIASEGPALLITVDCGVNYPGEVELAQALGLEVIVTDHHAPGLTVPDTCVVHPRLGPYPGSDLAGVGVALKLLHGLYVYLRGAEETCVPPELMELLDLVALGTVADVVPLLGENRWYVKEGLRRMLLGGRPGVRALLETARCSQDNIDAGTVAFRLAPRLNAPGRMATPELPLRLLLAEDDAEARLLAQELELINQQRQAVEGQILEQAIAAVERYDPLPPVLVLAEKDWHEGVVGIVASRLVERFHRPAILLAISGAKAKGSARSIPRYNLIAGLSRAAHLLDVFGGHAQAAGLTLPVDHLEEFERAMVTHASSVLSPDDLRPDFFIDAIVSGRDLSLEVAEALERLAPFGAGNPPVQLLALGADVCEATPTQNGDHLRCTLAVDDIQVRAIGFRLATHAPTRERCATGGPVHVGLRLEVDRWGGTMRPQIVVRHLFPATQFGEEALGCSPYCPYRDDPLAPPACSRCADPFSDVLISANEAIPWKDIRGQGIGPALLAQIISSGESVAVVCTSIERQLGYIAARVPLQELGVPGVDCVGAACWRTRLEGMREDSLLILDWRAAVRRFSLLTSRRHLIVLGPPYHRSHLAVLRAFSEHGGKIHLCYGPDERALTAKLVGLLVHPRPLMVCLYRTLRSQSSLEPLFEMAVVQIWSKYGIIPPAEELQRAWRILEELGLTDGSKKHELRDPTISPVYVAAVREYEEAMALCQSL